MIYTFYQMLFGYSCNMILFLAHFHFINCIHISMWFNFGCMYITKDRMNYSQLSSLPHHDVVCITVGDTSYWYPNICPPPPPPRKIVING